MISIGRKVRLGLTLTMLRITRAGRRCPAGMRRHRNDNQGGGGPAAGLEKIVEVEVIGYYLTSRRYLSRSYTTACCQQG